MCNKPSFPGSISTNAPKGTMLFTLPRYTSFNSGMAVMPRIQSFAFSMEDLSLSDIKKNASDGAEKQFLMRGLQQTAGKVSELAKNIDMNRSHLQTLLKKHGKQSKDYRITG